jgi:hypothetical protein
LKSPLRTFYDRHRDLIDRYGISVSQLTTNMFHLSQALNKSVRRGAQFVPMVMPTVLKNTPTKDNKYVVNQKVEHVGKKLARSFNFTFRYAD